MERFEHNAFWFDQSLKATENDRHVDFLAVEVRLLERINACDRLGALTLLKLDAMPTIDKLEQVEQRLFAYITQFSEYEEPVDECLKVERDLTEQQWERLELKLDDKIRSKAKFAPWENLLSSPILEPTSGQWECVEDGLFLRIGESLEQSESWVQYEQREQPPTACTLDVAEELLDRHLAAIAEKPDWEQVLQAEEVLPYSVWEGVEEQLFTQMSRSERAESLRKQPFWSFIEHYQRLLQGAGVTTLLIAFVVVGLVGFNKFWSATNRLPTVVYQMQGKTSAAYAQNSAVADNCLSVDGGSMTLVNAYGMVELNNNTQLNVKQLSAKDARYRVDFPLQQKGFIAAGGKATFFVHHHKANQSFTVETPDYQIVVMGTYFRVEPDLYGKVLTRVLEGAVKITAGDFKDTLLLAGQCLYYDASDQQYRIRDGGPVIQRKEIIQLPSIDELLTYRVTQITASVDGAEARIDGHYIGVTPVTLRQQPGQYRLQLSRAGYVPVDTTIVIFRDTTAYQLDVALSVMVDTTTTESAAMQPTASGVDAPRQTSGKVSPDQVADKMLGVPSLAEKEQLYADAQAAERSGMWQKALLLYEQISEDPGVSRLRHEDALFSIGKLYAEKGEDGAKAKQTFLTYLALFPNGSFAGESWLRLAELEFQKNPENAIQYYLKYFDLFPRHPRIAELQNRVGVIFLQQKRNAEAVAMFEQALSNVAYSNKTQQREIASNLHRALIAGANQLRAESIWARYLAQDAR